MNELYVEISGPKGVGKTQVAQKLAAVLMGQGVDLELHDDFHQVHRAEITNLELHLPESTKVVIMVKE